MKHSEVLTYWSSQQKIRIIYGNKHHREMQGKLFPLQPIVDLPFLSVDAEPPNTCPSKLEPVAALVQHQC